MLKLNKYLLNEIFKNFESSDLAIMRTTCSFFRDFIDGKYGKYGKYGRKIKVRKIIKYNYINLLNYFDVFNKFRDVNFLSTAAMNNDLRMIKYIINQKRVTKDRGEKWNYQKIDHETMSCAVRNNNKTLIDYLISEGYDFNSLSREYNINKHYCKFQNNGIVQDYDIFEYWSYIKYADDVLANAALTKDLKLISWLVQKKCPLTKYGITQFINAEDIKNIKYILNVFPDKVNLHFCLKSAIVYNKINVLKYFKDWEKYLDFELFKKYFSKNDNYNLNGIISNVFDSNVFRKIKHVLQVSLKLGYILKYEHLKYIFSFKNVDFYNWLIQNKLKIYSKSIHNNEIHNNKRNFEKRDIKKRYKNQSQKITTYYVFEFTYSNKITIRFDERDKKLINYFKDWLYDFVKVIPLQTLKNLQFPFFPFLNLTHPICILPNIHKLKYFYSQGYTISDKCVILTIQSNSQNVYPVLKWLNQNYCMYSPHISSELLKTKNFKLIQWFKNNTYLEITNL